MLFLAAFTCSPLFSFAATITAEVAGGDWNTGTTWVGGVVPTQWDEVIIPAGTTVSVSGNLTQTNHSGILNLNGTLQISGSFDRTGGENFIMGDGSTFIVGGSCTIPTPFTSGDAATITVNSALTLSGTTSLGTNNIVNVGAVMATAACSIGAGSEVRIEGSYSHTGTLDLSGMMIVEGNFTDATQTVNVNSGGELIVKGNVVDNSTFTIAGTMLVSGDFTKSSGGGVSVSGFLGIGGDYSITGSSTTISGDMTVLGEYSTDNSTSITGELSVVGVVTGATPTDKTIEADDPIWDTDEGVKQIYWEDFTGKTGETVWPDDGLSNWEILETSLASISGTNEGLSASFSNNRPANYYIWETDEVLVGCYTNLVISAYITGTLKANINFQYQLLINGTWQNWNNVGEVNPSIGLRMAEVSTSATGFRLRINANSIEGPGSINVDNISVSGTVGLGPDLPAIELITGFDQLAVCLGQTSVYRLDEEFATYSWSVSDPGSNTLTNAATSSATVVWGSLPATLSVTVSSECGRSGSAEWVISSDESFKLALIDLTYPSCFSTSDGSITVSASCGSGSYEYSIDTDPVQTNGTGIFSGLGGGDYVITCNDLTSSETDNITIELTAPDEIEITLLPSSSTFSCNSDFGCSGVLDFTVSGGTGTLVSTLEGTLDAGGDLVVDPVVQLVMSSAYSLNDYPLIVEVDKDIYPAVYDDFSDVRFFSDPDLTNPLYYWMDPNNPGIFYVKTNVSDGGSIYMFYGNADAYPERSSFTEVLTQGGMSLEYFTNASWAGSSVGCTDSEVEMNYSSGTFSDCNLELTATDQSFKWSGWIRVPAASEGYDNLKIYTGKSNESTGAVQIYVNGVDVDYGNKYIDISLLYGQLIFLEIWYSKTSTNVTTFEVGWSGNEGGAITGSDEFLNPSSALSRLGVTPEPTVEPVFSARYTGLCAGTYSLLVSDNGGTGCAVRSEDILIEVDNDAVTWETSSLPGTFSGNRDSYSGLVGGQTLYYNNFSSPVSSYTTTGAFSSELYKIKFDGNGTGTLTINTSTKGFKSIGIDFTAFQSVGGDPGWAATDYLRIDYEYHNGTSWTSAGGNPILYDTGIWSGENNLPGTQFPNNGNTVGDEFSYSFATPHSIEDKDNIRITFTVYTGSPDRNYYFDELRITGATDYSVDPDVSGIPVVLEAGVPGTIEPYYIDQVINDESCGGGIEIERTWNAVDNCGTYATPYVQNIVLYANSYSPTLTITAASEPATSYSFCNAVVSLNVPEAGATTCEPYAIYYQLNSGSLVEVYVSTDPLPTDPITVTFPQNQTSTFNWVLIDPILAEYVSSDYSVTIQPEFSASFSYNPDPPGFCEGGSATVTVTPSGGEAPYTYDFSATVSGITGSAGSGVTGQWTSDSFVDGDQVTVAITDAEGCRTIDRQAPNNVPITDSQTMTVYPPVVTPSITY